MTNPRSPAELMNDDDTTPQQRASAGLDVRIAEVLGNDGADPLNSTQLQELLVETEAAHEAAYDAFEAAQRLSLDPTMAACDAEAARSQMQAFEFAAARLREAYPRLCDRLDLVRASEQAAAWEQQYLQAEAQQNAIAAEFATIYPELVSQLVSLFERMAACDAEVLNINLAAPSGEHRRLATVEASVRGNYPITHLVVLPAWGTEADALQWPKPVTPLGAFVTSFVPPMRHRGGDWWKDLEARDQERQREAERVAAYYDQQAQQQEARENEIEAHRHRGRNGV